MALRGATGLVVMLAACAALDAPCPCGGRWLDPTGNDPAVVTPRPSVAHAREDHCICQCDGAGEELYMPPFQRECRAFEVVCVTEAGRSARLHCR